MVDHHVHGLTVDLHVDTLRSLAHGAGGLRHRGRRRNRARARRRTGLGGFRGRQRDLHTAIDLPALVSVIRHPRRGLPLARDRLLPRGQVRQLLEPLRHRLGPPLRQILVVRIISHIISVTRDRQIPTRWVLLDLLHHTRQHAVSLSRELIGVSRERDVPSHRHRRRLLILLRIRRIISSQRHGLDLEWPRLRLVELRLRHHIIH